MELIKPTVIARRALATLYNTTLLAGLVFRDYDADFAGKQGDTVNVRKPASFEAKVFDRAVGIELQDPRETSFPVTLDTILDVSFPVTAEELTLEIDDFAGRLLNPAMEAIVQDVDTRLAIALGNATVGGPTAAVTGTAATDTINLAGHRYQNGDKVEFPTLTGGAGLTAGTDYYVVNAATDTFQVSTTIGGTAVNFTTDITAGTVREVGGGTVTGTTANEAIRNARAQLSRAKVPLAGRGLLLSPEGTSQALGDDLFVTANQSGSTDALRNANVGRVFGFDSYESQAIGPTEPAPRDMDGVAFGPDAVALVTRTLDRPMGVAADQVAIENYRGLGLRVVRDYDVDKKQDIISIDFLLGTATLRPEAAVEVNLP
jgi:hypothetical protein